MVGFLVAQYKEKEQHSSSSSVPSSLPPHCLHHLLLLPRVMSGLPLLALTPLFPISLNMYLPHLALPACRL